jgi:hypothetical protein
MEQEEKPAALPYDFNHYYVLLHGRNCWSEPKQYRIVLCLTSSDREFMLRPLYQALTGWEPLHMKKDPDEMRYDMNLMYSHVRITDETGDIIPGSESLKPQIFYVDADSDAFGRAGDTLEQKKKEFYAEAARPKQVTPALRYRDVAAAVGRKAA